MKIEELEQIGLTKNEAIVYLALLGLGLASITSLIEKTKIHKQIIYDNIDRLEKKGLVSYVVKANRRYFNAVSPEKLLDLLKEEREEIDNKEEITKRLLPYLKILKSNSGEKQLATIYQDKKGIKSILEMTLNYKEILAYGAEGKFEDLFGPYWENYVNRIKKFKINLKTIYNEKLKSKRKKLGFLDIKYIPQEFESPATTIIFGDKVAIILWDVIPFAVLIESERIAKSYESYFNLLWKLAKP